MLMMPFDFLNVFDFVSSNRTASKVTGLRFQWWHTFIVLW